MKKIGEIDILGSGRPPLSPSEREKLNRQQAQQAKETGYQQLVELCYLGERERAQQLAHQNPHWGYEVVEGRVMEKID